MAGNVSEWVMDVYRPVIEQTTTADHRSFRGNVYQTQERDEDGFITEKDSLGRIKMVQVDANDNTYRRNYKQADNINFLDGDIESQINVKWDEILEESSVEDKKNVLENQEFRKAVLNEILDTTKNKLFVGNWEKIKLINTKRANLIKHIGMNLVEIANFYNKEPFDWLLDNAINDGFEDLFAAELLNSDKKEVQKLLKHQYASIALSDAGAHTSLLCDAGYGIELLSKWTRELKVFSLEDAVYNLTGKQADICRIPKRGRLVPGYFADMILFDPNKINTSAAYRKDDLPAKSDRLIVDPIGIKEIWVNGVNKNKNTAGKLIREYLS